MDRLELQAAMEKICKNVYYQPPSNINLVYPCIVYQVSSYNTTRANNGIYGIRKEYNITLITKNPDPLEWDRLVVMLKPVLNTPYVIDNLYHYKFTYSIGYRR